MIRNFGGCKIRFDSICQVSFSQREQVLYNLCICSCITNSCMEILSFGVIYIMLVVSNDGALIPHISHTIHFSNTNENRSSDKVPPPDILQSVGYGIKPLSMISINNKRPSHASSCVTPVKKLLYWAIFNVSLDM